MILHIGIVPALLHYLSEKGEKVIPDRYLGFNRGIIVQNIAVCNQGDGTFRDLIKDLALPELKILKGDQDLIDRVKAITKMEHEDLREYMVTHWDLTVESCQNDDWWVDIEGIRERVPKWARAVIEGAYIDGDDFLKWGRHQLMQEVRVNINIKRIKELREAAEEKKRRQQKALEEQYAEAQMFGMYL